MTNFIYDNTSLNGNKVDLIPIPGTANPQNYCQASDWNPAIQAQYDARGAIINGKYHGLAQQASDPLGLSTTQSAIWLNTSNQLMFHSSSTGLSTPITTTQHMSNDIINAACDGVTAVFTLAHAPIGGVANIYTEGVRTPPINYTLVGVTLTFDAGQIPPEGAYLCAEYNY